MPPAGSQQQRIERLGSWLRNPQASKRSLSDPPLQALQASDQDATAALVRNETAKRRKELADAAELAYASERKIDAALTGLVALRKKPVIAGAAPAWIKNLLAAAMEMDEIAAEAHNLCVTVHWASMDPESVRWA